MNSKFENDLIEICTAIAELQRRKNIGWNKSRKTKERLYGAEREFVAIRNKV